MKNVWGYVEKYCGYERSQVLLFVCGVTKNVSFLHKNGIKMQKIVQFCVICNYFDWMFV